MSIHDIDLQQSWSRLVRDPRKREEVKAFLHKTLHTALHRQDGDEILLRLGHVLTQLEEGFPEDARDERVRWAAEVIHDVLEALWFLQEPLHWRWGITVGVLTLREAVQQKTRSLEERAAWVLQLAMWVVSVFHRLRHQDQDDPHVQRVAYVGMRALYRMGLAPTPLVFPDQQACPITLEDLRLADSLDRAFMRIQEEHEENPSSYRPYPPVEKLRTEVARVLVTPERSGTVAPPVGILFWWDTGEVPPLSRRVRQRHWVEGLLRGKQEQGLAWPEWDEEILNRFSGAVPTAHLRLRGVEFGEPVGNVFFFTEGEHGDWVWTFTEKGRGQLLPSPILSFPFS